MGAAANSDQAQCVCGLIYITRYMLCGRCLRRAIHKYVTLAKHAIYTKRYSIIVARSPACGVCNQRYICCMQSGRSLYAGHYIRHVDRKMQKTHIISHLTRNAATIVVGVIGWCMYIATIGNHEIKRRCAMSDVASRLCCCVCAGESGQSS